MTANGPIFLDANIFMYTAGRDADWRAICDVALQKLLAQNLTLVTNAEVLQEILHRYFSQRRPADAHLVHRAAMDLCAEILPVTAYHTVRALEILPRHPRLSTRDAIHVATMEARGIRRILSVDSDFDAIPSVDRMDPEDFISA
ncbi:MAG: type II toxin-antitoxin system VapC family toxin [Acidobacteria bacterium]|nr:type II toxin-antitoxin system VapC family toxin [Acidobacteriota bacterium]